MGVFDPNSERSVKGLEFQQKIFDELKSLDGISELEMVWDLFNRLDPGLSNYDYACYEKQFGDITFMKDGKRYWVECCFIMATHETKFHDLKRQNFKGPNKWYCFGKMHHPEQPPYFIPSKSWNAYTKKCDLKTFGHSKYRMINVDLIGDNIKVAVAKTDKFFDKL